MSDPDTIAPVHEPSARSDAAYATVVDPSSVAGGAIPPRGWRPRPGELVSLWDMLRFNAGAFAAAMGGLAKLESSCARMQKLHDKLASELGCCPQAVAEQLASGKGFGDIGEEFRKEIVLNREARILMLDDLEESLTYLNLCFSVVHVQRMRQRSLAAPQWGAWHELVKELRSRIKDELEGRVFFFVAPERAKYFLDDKPFGEKVPDKFPGITGDIVDAGWCLGIGRASAAVYHLMLVMEFGVRRLAKRLRLPKHLEHEPWGTILREAWRAVNAMPYGSTKERSRRDRYNEVLAHLNSVKDAWRNPTMHSRRRYTEEEAEAIYGNVKTFMNYLAEKVF